jgi:PilZ domain
MTLPVTVWGADCYKRQWRELAATLNVSAGGVALRLSTRVMIGDMLFVEFALPARLRKNPDPSGTYKSYGLVRYIEMQSDGEQIVRLQFVKQPTPAMTPAFRLQLS